VLDEIGAALDRLDSDPAPAAVRFDEDAPLAGHVVVLPAAFNPPTLAHLHLLQRAAEHAGPAHPLALLTTRNVDKAIFGASLPHRVAMLLAARADHGGFAVAASNQARILDQAGALRAAFPAATFDFVVGFDTLERLFAPRYYTDMERELREFFSRHRVLAANRGEMSPSAVGLWIEEHTGPFSCAVTLLPIDPAPARLSSTLARQAASSLAGRDVVPPAVYRYIVESGLYLERTVHEDEAL